MVVHTRQVQARWDTICISIPTRGHVGQEGTITHPSVLYLTGGDDKEAAGDNCLGPNARCGTSGRQMLEILSQGQFLLFQGIDFMESCRVLRRRTRCDGSTTTHGSDGLQACWKDPSDVPSTNRLTFMVGFGHAMCTKKMKNSIIWSLMVPLLEAAHEKTPKA
jgi:hypothetical protein